MNACGNIVATRLRDIPRRVREVTRHGVCRGAAIALATAQYQSSHNFWQVDPVDLALGGEEWEEFEELANDMEMAATAISEDISIKAIIGNLFADE